MFITSPNIKIKNLSQKNFNTLMLFRCTTLEYANKFLESGNIRFGLPKEWIEAGKKYGRGRGDVLEGAFAGGRGNDKQVNNFYGVIRPNVEMNKSPLDGYYFFQSSDVLNMRTFCLFGLNDNLFTKTVRAQDHKLRPLGKITKKYFKDFYPDITKDNYDLLEDKDKPVLLMIKNPHEFFERLRSFLRGFGLNDNEYIIAPVQYENLYEPFFIDELMPHELFFKDDFFRRQSEIRVVITSTCKSIINKFNRCNGIVNIGQMADIAEYQEYYFDDFQMLLKDNSIVFTLPKSETRTIRDPILLIDITHQALRDELPGAPMTIEQIEEYITPLIKLLEEHYDILYDSHNHKFYRKDYSQCWDLSDAWDTLLEHGVNYLNEKEYEQAIDAFSKAIHFNPDKAEAWYERAHSYYWLNKYEEMLGDMKEAGERDSRYLDEYQILLSELGKIQH